MVDVGTAVGYLMLDTSGFQSGFKSALADLQTFRDESATAADKFSAAGAAMSAVGGSLTKSVTLPLVGVGAAVMKVGSDFEAQMSRVQAISGATGDELKALTDQAIDLGATTAFSAGEAAEGMENLASAGFTTQEIMSAMPGLLDLAASSGAELGTASEIAASAIRGFGLEASDAGHVADVFAEAAARTNAQTEDMGEAMKYIAPVAKAMGQSLEETAAAVGIMSDAGIKGSQAGTSLRGALSRLAKPTDVMLAKMEELGLSFYDAQDNMLPLNGIIEQLETSMAGLTQEQRNNALVTLFGQESLSGMLALMERGPEELRSLTESFENCDGAAAEMAETMLDNTKGSVEEMMGSIETLAIRLQQVMAPAITAVVEKITEFVNKLSSMSPETLQMIVTIAGVVAALGPLLLILGKVSSAIGSIMGIITKAAGAWSTWTAGLAAAGTSVGAVLGPIIAVVAAIATLVAAFKTLWDTNEEFRNGIIETWNGIKESFSNFADGLLERINSLGFNFESLTQVLGAVWTEFCNLLGPLFQGAFEQIGIILETVFGVITGLFDTFKGLFTGDWDTFWQGVTGIFSSLWNGVISTIQNVLTTLGNLVNVILGWFGTSWQELWQSVVDFFSNAWNNILNFFTTMGTNISNAFRSFIDGVVSFFSNLPENIGFIIGQVLGHIANFVVSLGQKAIEAGQTFLTNIINFFQQLPGNIQNFISQALSNIQTWASNLLTSAQQAGQNFINGVVQFFQTLPSRIQTFLTNAINSVRTWGTNMLSAAKTAATNVINGIVNTFTSLPGKMLEIGRNLVNGLKNGIMGALSNLLGSIKSFGNSVISGFKSVFGIHSPSTEMIEQGLMLTKGLSVGLKDGQGQVIKTAEDLSKAILDTSTKWVNDKKFYNQLAAKDELAFWEQLKSIGGLAGEELEQVNKNIYTARQNASKEAYEHSKNWIEQEVYYNRLSAEEVVEAWERVVNRRNLQAKEQQEAEKNLYKAQQDLLKKQVQAEEEAAKAREKAIEEERKAQEQALKEYKSNLESRAKSLRSFAGLFDKVTVKQENSGKDLLNNLKSQVEAFKGWQQDMLSLEKRGVSGDLLEELRDLGPQAAGDIKALTQLTDAELDEYIKLFGEKSKLAAEQASYELGGGLVGGIKETFDEVTQTLVTLVETANDSIPALSIWGEDDQNNITLYSDMVSKLTTLFSQLYSVVNLINTAFAYMASLWANIAKSFTIIRVESLKILETIREQAEAYEDLAESIYEYIEALKELQEEQERQEEITTKRAESSSSSSSSSGSRVGRAISNTVGAAAAGATYIFNSPVAVTPTKAAQLMKKTAQQLALDF